MNRLLLPLLFLVPLVPVVACGSSSSDPPFPVAAPTSTGTPSRPSRPPSSSGDEPPEDMGCPENVAMTAADLDKEIGWKNTLPAKGSCTAEDLTKLAANFQDSSLRTYFDIAKGLSEPCKACTTSKDTDATWGPIVGTAADNGETGFVNYGACFGAIEGDACGKAIQYELFCEDIACGVCAFTAKERQQCVSKAIAADGVCSSFVATKQTACPSWTLNVKSCGDILDAVKTLCGP